MSGTRNDDRDNEDVDSVFKMERVEAYNTKHGYEYEAKDDEVFPPTHVNFSNQTIKAFQDMIEQKAPQILGAKYTNPYSGKIDEFPPNAAELTGYHLQILARNQASNTDGSMGRHLYGLDIPDSVIHRLHYLVTTTTISSVVEVDKVGGYGGEKPNPAGKVEPYQAVLVDQAGLQFQNDLHNTGSVFFYPDDPGDPSLPPGYAKYQNEMYQAAYGKPRPTYCSGEYIDVIWNGVKGRVDINATTGYGFGIQIEFGRLLKAGAHSAEDIDQHKEINLRYLKAGLGFFNAGIIGKDPLPITEKDKENQLKMEEARLQGILNHLKWIAQLPEEDKKVELGRIASMDLPFSNSVPGVESFKLGRIKALLGEIKTEAEELGLKYKGDGVIDALKNDDPKKTANISNNTGDPFAANGNEGIVFKGVSSSVDTMIANNSKCDHLIPGVNKGMTPTQDNLLDRLLETDLGHVQDVTQENNEQLEKVASMRAALAPIERAIRIDMQDSAYELSNEIQNICNDNHACGSVEEAKKKLANLYREIQNIRNESSEKFNDALVALSPYKESLNDEQQKMQEAIDGETQKLSKFLSDVEKDLEYRKKRILLIGLVNGLEFSDFGEGFTVDYGEKSKSLQDGRRVNCYKEGFESGESSFYKQILLYAMLSSEHGATLQESIIKGINATLGLQEKQQITRNEILSILKSLLKERCRNSAGHDVVQTEKYLASVNKVIEKVVYQANTTGHFNAALTHDIQRLENKLSIKSEMPDQIMADLKDLGSRISFKFQGKAELTHEHKGLATIIDFSKSTSKTKWSDIITECKKRTAPVRSWFSHFNALLAMNKRDSNVDLIYRAIAQFNKNAIFNPHIDSLEKLIIAQQKREIIQKCEKEIARLEPDRLAKGDKSSDNKILAYKEIIENIKQGDKNVSIDIKMLKDLEITVNGGGRRKVVDVINEKRGTTASTSGENLRQILKSELCVNPGDIIESLKPTDTKVAATVDSPRSKM